MTEDDFESYLASLTDTPVLASVTEDAERRTRLEGREVPLPEETRIITIANQKGGVGKTTTAVNLAAALAQSGQQVLVIDIDPQGNASTALSIPHGIEDASIYDVLLDGAPIKDVVQACPTVDNIQVVPATIELAGAEIELVTTVSRETKLREAIHTYIAERAAQGLPTHYVIIDCPPSLGLLTINAFTAAREVLIPIQCEYYALEGLSMLVRNIELIRGSLNPDLWVSMILLTMFDKRTKLSLEVADEVRAHFPNQVLETTIPRSVRIAEAPSHGETVITYDPTGTGALSYLEAAAEIADRGAISVPAR
ncbi:ParA family protein [Kribbia dieselivorans]|uniref:ParA family protein n=1 Tax=Kribbia dieselivorans TaxID=331526 RepID=UPI000838B95F|nr:AAA family ATPase [Kribbia dieselivorans]